MKMATASDADDVNVSQQTNEESECIIDVSQQFGVAVEDMKSSQKEALQFLLSGNDVLTILPTGYGKSLIYHMYPHMLASLGTVLVVSPLVYLMKDQISMLTERGQSAGLASEFVDGNVLPTYLYG
ncbi:putative ATP-dependent DNA helicase RecS [Glandiceps talaboti]